MTPSPRAPLRALPGAALLSALALLGAGCVRQAPESHASAAERAACTQHADTVYTMRNPDGVYQADTYATSIRDEPYAGAGGPGLPTEGLSNRYQREQWISDCLNGGNGTVGAAPDAPAPEDATAATPPAPPPQP